MPIQNKSDKIAEESFNEIFGMLDEYNIKESLTIDKMLKEVSLFCEYSSEKGIKALYGASDGKAVGTPVEKMLKIYLSKKYKFNKGNSGKGVDLPDERINTDIKVTSISQPQSSSPYKDSKQKVLGLGYNLLIFVYKKTDNNTSRTAHLEWKDCIFVEAKNTADYSVTEAINNMLQESKDSEYEMKIAELTEILASKNVPGDNLALRTLSIEVLKTAENNGGFLHQGQITISNALQWRMNYGRVVGYSSGGENKGVKKLI